jgi:hypothetical protein
MVRNSTIMPAVIHYGMIHLTTLHSPKIQERVTISEEHYKFCNAAGVDFEAKPLVMRSISLVLLVKEAGCGVACRFHG